MAHHIKAKWGILRCRFSTLDNSGSGKHLKYMPHAFTEQGVAMLSSVLNNSKAIEINIGIIRAFVKIRKYALMYNELSIRLKEVEGKFKDVYEAINYLLQKDKMQVSQGERVKIGYKIKK